MSYNKYIDEFNIEDNWDIRKTDNTIYVVYKNSYHGSCILENTNTATIMAKYKAYLRYLNNQQDKLINIINNLQNLTIDYAYKISEYKMNANRERDLNEYELKALGNGKAFRNCKEKFDPAEVVLTNE